MNFTNLRLLSRAYCPGAKLNVISNPRRDLILNEGARDVAFLSKCLSAKQKFNAVAEQADYDLSSVIDRYLLPQKSGLWWYDGSSWKRLYPRTMKYMDRKFPQWRDDSSSSPLRFFIEGDILTAHPIPDTALTEGFWLYFFQAPQSMTSGFHYPFGFTTEIARLSILSEAILKYWKWKAIGIIGKASQNEMLAAETAYKKEVFEKLVLLRRRPDIAADGDVKFGGQTIGR